MRLSSATDGTPDARAITAASRLGADTPLTEVSPVGELMRDIENTALGELDVMAARHIADVDRRFNRATSRLETELARRQSAEPQNLTRRHPITMDALGFVTAAVSIGVLLSGRRSGTSIPTDLALVIAAFCGVIATVCHLTATLRAVRTRTSNTQGWHLVLFTAVLLFASAALGYWRFSGDPEAGFLTAALAIAVLIAAGVFTAVLVVRGSSARAAEASRKAEREKREEALRSDLRVKLLELQSLCRGEVESVFAGLQSTTRDSLDRAVEAGIAAVEKRGILESAALRKMRKSRRGELRYDLSL